MSTLTLEFPLPDGAATVKFDTLKVDLGNGCRLISTVPTWVKSVGSAKLVLLLEIEGSPDAKSRSTPE